MKLEISVIKHRGNPPSSKQDYLFNQEGGNIGRSEDNTWSLPDERNFLSRVQATIIFQNKKFHLIDKSSNGCFINQSSSPVGKGSSYKLSNNDIIRMGEYELQVSYIDPSDIDENDSSYDMFTSNNHSAFPPNNISQAGISDNDPFDDVFRPKYENENNYIKPDVDSSFNSSSPISIPSPEDNNTTTTVNKKINPIANISPPPSPSELAQNQSSNNMDSLLNTSNRPSTDGGGIEKPILPIKEDSTPDEQAGSFTKIFGEKQSLRNDESLSQVESEKPDNPFSRNNNHDINSEEIKEEQNKEISKPQKTENSLFSKMNFNEDELIFSEKDEDENSTQIIGKEKILKDNSHSSLCDDKKSNDIFNADNHDHHDIIKNTISSNTEIKVEHIEKNNFTDSSPVQVDNKVTKKEQIKAPEEGNLLFEELFKAAGIDTQKTKVETTKETAILIGKILQAMLQGTMDLLRSRAETKDVFRVGDKTIISVARNNPLKFLPTTEYVITQLILSNDNQLAYTPLVEAIEESFDDLKAHQFALSMSIQEALSSTIKDYFSPKNLQKKLEKSGSIGSKLPWQKKANLWKLFEEAYDGIEEEASEQFQLVLERKIADAYEFHMQQIKQQRS